MTSEIITQIINCTLAFLLGWSIKGYREWLKEMNDIRDRSAAILADIRKLEEEVRKEQNSKD